MSGAVSIERGTCRECDRPFTLTKRGDVRHHGKPKTFPPERCPGAGQEPKEHLRLGRDYQVADVYRALGEPVPDAWREPGPRATEPCPQGCGGNTEDPYGGPCNACWLEVPR